MTETTEMEMKVAEAMYLDASPSIVVPLKEYVGRELWIQSARVAIRAMREPTEDMVKRAYDPTENFGKAVCEAMWQAMIDAASPER